MDAEMDSANLKDFEESSPAKMPKENLTIIDTEVTPPKIAKTDLITEDVSGDALPKSSNIDSTENETVQDLSEEFEKKDTSPFKCAFDNLKKSEFFTDKLPENTQSDKEITTGVPKPKSLSYDNLLVNPKQRGNPLMKYISNIPWEYSEIIPDYAIGRNTCILFLSLRYHQLNPDYIHDRLKQLGNSYNLRVLLVQVDIIEPHHSLRHLTRICILTNMTLMLAWNPEDAGRIIETYKIYEKKPPDMIMERSDTGIQQKLINSLTSVRSVNKTDAMNLLTNFGSLSEIIKTPVKTLGLCPGVGPQKAQRLYKTLHETFLRSDT